MHRHIWYMVVILEEVRQPLPRFPKCDMFVTWRVLSRRHQDTETAPAGGRGGRRDGRRKKRGWAWWWPFSITGDLW